MDTKKLLGKKLKEIIKKKGWSQEYLAESVGIEPTALSNIVTGRNYPLFSTLEKIVKVLDTSFFEVFDFDYHNTEQNLKEKIIEILDKNPDKIQDFYKIIVALTK